MKIHIVQKGDTLWEIAKQYGVDFNELKSMNTQLANPDLIMPGMKIKIPSGSKSVQSKAQGHYKAAPAKKHEVKKEMLPKSMPTVPAPIIQPDDHKPPKEIQLEMPIYHMPQMPQQPITTLPKIEFDMVQQSIVQQQAAQTQTAPAPQPKAETPVQQQPVVHILPIQYYPVFQPYPVQQPTMPSPCCSGPIHYEQPCFDHYEHPCGPVWHHHHAMPWHDHSGYPMMPMPYHEMPAYSYDGHYDSHHYDPHYRENEAEDRVEPAPTYENERGANQEVSDANESEKRQSEDQTYADQRSQNTYGETNAPRFFENQNLYAESPNQQPYSFDQGTGTTQVPGQNDYTQNQNGNHY